MNNGVIDVKEDKEEEKKKQFEVSNIYKTIMIVDSL